MPNKPNAVKALKQAKKRAILNRMRKNAFKNGIKEIKKTEKIEDALKLVQKTQKALDKAAKQGVIKKKTAARKLSRLMKSINKRKVEKK